MRKYSRKKIQRLDASIIDYLASENINPVAEWLKVVQEKFCFIVEKDFKRPEVREMISKAGLECWPIDQDRLCAECRKLTEGAVKTCSHCGSADVHPYVEVRRSGYIAEKAWAAMTEFAYPKLRSSEVTGSVQHQVVINLNGGTGETKAAQVIDLDPERRIMGENAQTSVRR